MAVGADGARLTGIENIYGGRRVAEAFRGRRPAPTSAASDCAQALRILQSFFPLRLVVHRTNLAGQHSGAALVVGIRGGHFLAAERERRGGNTRDLAHQPAANQPREMPADEGMDTSAYHGFAGMMGDPRANLRRSNFSCCWIPLCQPRRLAAQEHEHPPQAGPDRDEQSWSWTTDANVFFGYNYQQRQFADFRRGSRRTGDARRRAPVGRGRLT